MKELRFNNRERTVIRAIDEANGTLGAEILETANLEDLELLNIVQSLVNIGVLETYEPNAELPMLKDLTMDALRTTRIELNPAFSQEVRQAMRRT